MNRIAVLLCVVFVVLVGRSLYADPIKRIDIIGNSIPIKYIEQLRADSTSYDENDVRIVTSEIITAYKRKGYSLVYVNNVSVSDAGIVTIYIVEPRIAAISVLGDDARVKAIIEKTLEYQQGKVFNSIRVARLLRLLKSRLDLYAIDYTIENENTPAVSLVVRFSRYKRGKFYGHMNLDFVYGFSPLVGYYRMFDETALDVSVQAGIADNQVRKTEGKTTFYFFSKNELSAWIAEIRGGRVVDYWDRYAIDYRDIFLNPSVGYKIINGNWDYTLTVSQTTHWLDSYRYYDGRVFDVRLLGSIKHRQRKRPVDGFPGVDMNLTAGCGWEDLNNALYAIGEADLFIYYSISPWVRLEPYAGSFYTTSNERLNWTYVYSYRYIVESDVHRTTSWKNILGTNLLFKVSEDLFAGPFINSGYFYDEYRSWCFETGTGLKGVLQYDRVTINVLYAWNIKSEPTDGGILFYLQGRF